MKREEKGKKRSKKAEEEKEVIERKQLASIWRAAGEKGVLRNR